MIYTDLDTIKKQSEFISFEKAKEIQIFEELEKELAASEISGYGLAAIQIGKPYACFMYKWKDQIYRIMNPMIYQKTDLMIHPNEGCLSLPGKYINTDRFSEILVSFDNYDTGKNMKAVLSGTEAIIFQHEYDHVAGITILDREHKSIPKQGRNELCACGSGKKFKKCCGR